MWGQIGAAAAGAASSLLGGNDVSKYDTARYWNTVANDWTRKEYNRTNLWNNKNFDEAKRQYTDATRYAIQNKVKDAKAAGLHPLYALGASSSVSPNVPMSGSGQIPNFMPSQQTTGSGPRDIAASMVAGQKAYGAIKPSALSVAQLRAVNASASLDEAQATLALSQAARTAQTQTPTNDAALVDRILNKPSEVISTQKGRPGTVAGQHAAFKEIVVGKNRDGSPLKVRVATNPDETFAEGLTATGLTVLKNLGMLDGWGRQKRSGKRRLTRRGYR